MGLFDFLKPKKEDTPADDEATAEVPEASPQAGSWKRRFRRFRDREDDEKLALCEALLQELGGRYERSKIKRLIDDDEVELRARVDDIPFRVNLEYDMGWVRPEMKITNRTGELELERDLEKIPQTRDDDDDWADDDEVRVFVARGIFAEGDTEEVDQTLATLDALPAEVRDRLLAEIQRLGVNRLYAFSETMDVGFEPNVDDMDDPIQQIADGVTMMRDLALALAAGDRDMASEPKVIIRGHVEINGQIVAPTPAGPPIPAVARASCTYCGTTFVLGAVPNCPNCGAAHTA